jgi:glutathione S-transferase
LFHAERPRCNLCSRKRLELVNSRLETRPRNAERFAFPVTTAVARDSKESKELERKAASYLAINPLGQLPAIVDGDVTICESAAIALYLTDKAHAAKLAPPVGDSRRAEYLHWVGFTVATQLIALSPRSSSRVRRRGAPTHWSLSS